MEDVTRNVDALSVVSLFTAPIVYVVVSVYWMSPILMGNYMMIIRNNGICVGGMDATCGIISSLVVIALSILAGSVYFNKKNIL